MTSIGNIEIQDLFVGSNNAVWLYLGAAKVWEKSEPPPPPPAGPWLCFTAETANSTVRLDKVGSPDAISLETSTDGTTWTDYGWTNKTGDTLTMTNIGDRVYMRAKTENTTIGSSSSKYYKFVGTGSFGASGNIQSLLKADCSRTDAQSYCYYGMFSFCQALTSAPTLPATTLADDCYENMFRECHSLTSAPALPATTLASSCYYQMFNGCTSLTDAPSLPATTLAESCYSSMFSGCTSLTSAPALSATTLANNCCENMFSSCTSLTSAPALPATTLASECYSGMFSGCSSLTTAPALPATTLAIACYYYMFYGCSSLTSAPALPATTLAYNCYENMFNGCTSLTSAPALPATTLPDHCYSMMFYDCVQLSYMEVSFDDWKEMERPTEDWVVNAGSQASGTKIFKCPSNLYQEFGDSSIPDGWTVVTTD